MNPPAPESRRVADDHAALISALVDGEARAVRPVCERWCDDAQTRSTWHAYHLIGDVLRAEDLAAAPERDEAFLAALRARLAHEPVVLAPRPEKAPVRRAAWLPSAAVAAGFAALAGLLVLGRLSMPANEGSAALADGSSNSNGGGLALTAGGARPVQALLIEGRLIRDERLDAYLRAHREAGGGFAVAVPGAMPRNIEMLAPVMPMAHPISR